MTRLLASCAALVAVGGFSILVADSDNLTHLLRGTYSFTLSEKCTHQISGNTPGFNSSFQIVDKLGAETYSGASNGLMDFDGGGNVTIQQGLATNLMNAPNRLVTGQIPFGFGLGPALPFTCTGTYTITKNSSGMSAINIPLTCNAKIPLPNPLSTSGFQSEFSFQGIVPSDTSTLALTDIGNKIQPVTIYFPNNPPTSPASQVMQQRVCTRSATLTMVSQQPMSHYDH